MYINFSKIKDSTPDKGIIPSLLR